MLTCRRNRWEIYHGVQLMRTLALVSWKGGTGKTTLACNLAERAAAAGLVTTLCDFDPQATCLSHCQMRA